MIAMKKWAKDTGISQTTAWRWSKAGWIHPVNVAGKMYLTAEDIQQFTVRATAGEFAKQPSGCVRAKKQAWG